MSESDTERAHYMFTVKEFGDGTPWIMLEQSGKGLASFRDGFVGFDLKEGISLREAERLAQLLTDSISAISYTTFTR